MPFASPLPPFDSQATPPALERPNGLPHVPEPAPKGLEQLVLADAGQAEVTAATGSPAVAAPGLLPADPATRLLLEQLLGAITQPEASEQRRNAERWHFSSYVKVARRRKKSMIIAGSVVFFAALVALRPRGPSFSATSVMLLPTADTSSDSLSSTLSALGSGVAAMPSNTNTQIAIITSPVLVEEALGKFSNAELMRGWRTTDVVEAQTKARVEALQGESPDLIQITAYSADPNLAVTLANRLIDVYDERTQQLANRTTAKNTAMVHGQVVQAYALMMSAKNELRAFKEQTGILDLPTRLESDAELTEELQSKTDRAQEAVAAGQGDASVQTDDQRSLLQQNLKDAQEKYQEVLRAFYPSAPEALKAADDVHEAETALNLRTQSLLQMNQARLASAQSALKTQNALAASMPRTEVKLQQLQDRVDLLSNTYKQLYDHYTSLSLNQKALVDTATALTPATFALPTNHSLPVIGLLAMLCGLVAAALYAGLLESLDTSFHSTDDLSTVVSVPVLGSVPLLLSGQERQLPRLHNNPNDSGVLLEACRVLRSNLLFASETPLSTVLVTSADPGEGKSLSAANLAAAMALDGRRVLLMDCDLRRPTQHTLAETTLEPGLTDVLTGKVTMDAALRTASTANLWVLTAGALPFNPPELLGSEKFRSLLELLKLRFDLIILDSPPAISLADAQVLSALTDGVILVVAADTTPRARVHRAERLLRHVGARLLGTVFNKVQEHQDEYLWSMAYNGYLAQDRDAQGPRANRTKSLS